MLLPTIGSSLMLVRTSLMSSGSSLYISLLEMLYWNLSHTDWVSSSVMSSSSDTEGSFNTGGILGISIDLITETRSSKDSLSTSGCKTNDMESKLYLMFYLRCWFHFFRSPTLASFFTQTLMESPRFVVITENIFSYHWKYF